MWGWGERQRERQDTSCVALIGTTSHTEVSYCSRRQQPCFTSCLPVLCLFPLSHSGWSCLQHHWPISIPIKCYFRFLFPLVRGWRTFPIRGMLIGINEWIILHGCALNPLSHVTPFKLTSSFLNKWMFKQMGGGSHSRSLSLSLFRSLRKPHNLTKKKWWAEAAMHGPPCELCLSWRMLNETQKAPFLRPVPQARREGGEGKMEV